MPIIHAVEIAMHLIGTSKLPRTPFMDSFRIADDSGQGHYLLRTFTITALIVAAPLHARNHERHVVLLWLAIREH